MALTKQSSPNRTTVSVDFPPLPSPPAMKIPEDHAAMMAHHSEMQNWYKALRQSLLDKMGTIQTQVDKLKG